MFTINNKWTESDTLLIGLFEDTDVNDHFLMKVKGEIGVDLNPYIQTGGLSSNRRQLEKVLLPENDKLQRVYVVGMGSSQDMSEDHYRKTMGLTFQRLKKDMVDSSAIFLDSLIPVGWSAERCSTLISEVMLTSTFRLPSFKTNQKDDKDTDSLVVWTNEEQAAIQAAFEKGRAFADGVNTARYLVHLPANILTASEMAEFATTMAEDYDFEINILDKEDMEELGMGALLAVNQGSTNL